MQAHESTSWAAFGRRIGAARGAVAAALAAIAVAASADVTIRVDAVRTATPPPTFMPTTTPTGRRQAERSTAWRRRVNGEPRSWRTAVPDPATSSCRCRVARFRCSRPGRWATVTLAARGAVYDAVFPTRQ
jgi:hypothetical protein